MAFIDQRVFRLGSFFVVVVVFATQLIAFDDPNDQRPVVRTSGNHGKTGAETSLDAEIETCIQQLTAASFSAREKATEQLLEIGEPGLVRLREVTAGRLELQTRLQAIVSRIESDRLERLSKNFLLDGDSEGSYGLPGWECYRQFAGVSRTSKLLFLDMLREQPELVQLIDQVANRTESSDGEPATREQMLLEKVTVVANRLREDRLTRLQVPDIGDLVGVLLATSRLEGLAPVEINELLAMSAHSIPITTYMQRRGYNTVLRSLYSQWIPKTHPAMAFDAMEIALHYGYPTGVEIARGYLAPHFDLATRETAIQCLARFGNASDLDLLEPLLNDDTVCGEFPQSQLPRYLMPGLDESDEPPPGAGGVLDVKDKVLWQYRIRDLALAASMLIAEEDVRKVFPNFIPREQEAFDPSSLAVRNEKEFQFEREKQIEAWKNRGPRGVGDSGVVEQSSVPD